jgi:hypothetical protein
MKNTALGKYAIFLYNDWKPLYRNQFNILKIGREWKNRNYHYEISLLGFSVVWFKRNKKH